MCVCDWSNRFHGDSSALVAGLRVPPSPIFPTFLARFLETWHWYWHWHWHAAFLVLGLVLHIFEFYFNFFLLYFSSEASLAQLSLPVSILQSPPRSVHGFVTSSALVVSSGSFGVCATFWFVDFHSPKTGSTFKFFTWLRQWGFQGSSRRYSSSVVLHGAPLFPFLEAKECVKSSSRGQDLNTSLVFLHF